MKKKFLLAAAMLSLDCALNLAFGQATAATMKAVVVNEYGGPEVLKYQDAPRPEPKGSGGVGHFAIQIAKARGAKVIATASTANQEFLKQMGADVVVDYTKQKFEDVAKEVDLVLDSVGEDTLKRSYGAVKKGGMIVSIVDDCDPKELAAHGIRGTTIRTEPNAKTLEELARLIDARKITPVVSQVFPLSDVAKAHEQIATRHTRGKIVLKVTD